MDQVLNLIPRLVRRLQHFLYFLLLPQGQGLFLPTLRARGLTAERKLRVS